MKRRILSIVLCLAMVAALLPQAAPVASAAGASATFVINDVTAQPGEVVTVPVSAAIVNMYYMEYEVSYDAALAMVTAPQAADFTEFTITPTTAITSNPYRVILESMYTANRSGVVINLIFKAPSVPGRYPVSVDCLAYNSNYETGKTVEFEIIVGDVAETGMFSIEDVTVAPGEVAEIPVFAKLKDMSSMEYLISYGEGLSLAQKPTQAGFEDFDMTPGSNIAKNPYKVIFDGIDPISEMGTAMVLYMNVPETPGTYTVSVECSAFSDLDEVYETVVFNIKVADIVAKADISAESITVIPGEIFKIPVKADASNAKAIELGISYDEELKMHAQPVKGPFEFKMTASENGGLLFENETTLSGKGELVSLTFKAPKTEGEYKISLSSLASNDCSDAEDAETVTVTVEKSTNSISVDDVTISHAAYDDFVVEIPVDAEIDDMYSMEFLIHYDEALVITQKPEQMGFADFDMTPGGVITRNPYKVIFDGMEPITEKDTAFNLCLEAPYDYGTYPVEVEFWTFNDDIEVYHRVGFDINVVYKGTVESGLISVGSAQAMPGETVEIPITSAEEMGVGRMKMQVAVPQYLTLKDVKCADALSGMQFTTNLSEGVLDIEWYSTGDHVAVLEGSDLATMVFEISDDAPEGELPLVLTVNEIENRYCYIVPQTVDGAVTVVHYQKGDINGDGRLNTRDVATLRRYLAGGYEESITYIEALTDVNGDGRKNTRDVAALRAIIAG